MIGNMSSQRPQPKDDNIDYYVEQNKSSNTLTDLQKKMIDQYRKWVKDKGKFTHGNGPQGSSYLPGTLNVLKNYGVICSNCVFYDAPNKACAIVSGEIDHDAICKFWVIPNNKIEGGEKYMSNDNLEKGVVPAVDVTATTEPDGKGTMATAKGEFPANAKEKVTRRYAKKSLKKAIRSIEKAKSSLSEISINKAALPKTGRASGTPTVANQTSPYKTDPHVTKGDMPDVGRATSVTVANETNPYGEQLVSVRSALLALRKAEKALVGVGRYANIANKVTQAPDQMQTAEVAKGVTDDVENIASNVLKGDASDAQTGCTCCSECVAGGCNPDQCCSGSMCCSCCDKCSTVNKAAGCDCDTCTGAGCDCCQKCAGMMKAADTDNDGDTDADTDNDDDSKTSIKKSVWGGTFLPN